MRALLRSESGQVQVSLGVIRFLVLLAAAFVFLLTVFGVTFSDWTELKMVALGLFFFALAFLVP